MNYIIHISKRKDEKFLQSVRRLIQVESTEVKEVVLSLPSLTVAQGTSDYIPAKDEDTEVLEFSEQLNALLPTLQNIRLKNNLEHTVKFFKGEQESKSVNGSQFYSLSKLKELSKTKTDLIIFDIEELSNHPQILGALFHVLKSRPCSVLFLNPKAVRLKKIILKYSGKDASIYSIYAFSMFFPKLAGDADDSILISPFSFKKSLLVLEKRLVKLFGAYYGGLGFIKLPFTEVEDYFYYAKKANGDLLILSKSDLTGIKDLFSEIGKEPQNRQSAVSIFVG